MARRINLVEGLTVVQRLYPGYAKGAKTGPEWTADDFRRSVAQHGKELSPSKELVLRYLVDNYGPAEIPQRTEGWGRAPAPEEPTAPEFSPETEKLVKALGVSDEGKAALGKMNLGDGELQKYLIKLDTKDLDRLSDGKLVCRRIRK
jgi:hypothetical protein